MILITIGIILIIAFFHIIEEALTHKSTINVEEMTHSIEKVLKPTYPHNTSSKEAATFKYIFKGKSRSFWDNINN